MVHFNRMQNRVCRLISLSSVILYIQPILLPLIKTGTNSVEVGAGALEYESVHVSTGERNYGVFGVRFRWKKGSFGVGLKKKKKKKKKGSFLMWTLSLALSLKKKKKIEVI